MSDRFGPYKTDLGTQKKSSAGAFSSKVNLIMQDVFCRDGDIRFFLGFALDAYFKRAFLFISFICIFVHINLMKNGHLCN